MVVAAGCGCGGCGGSRSSSSSSSSIEILQRCKVLALTWQTVLECWQQSPLSRRVPPIHCLTLLCLWFRASMLCATCSFLSTSWRKTQQTIRASRTMSCFLSARVKQTFCRQPFLLLVFESSKKAPLPARRISAPPTHSSCAVLMMRVHSLLLSCNGS